MLSFLRGGGIRETCTTTQGAYISGTIINIMFAFLLTCAMLLQAVRNFWGRRDVRGTLSALKAAGDPSATLDILDAASAGHGLFGSLQLESCGKAAQLLQPLLGSPHSRYQEAGMDALSCLLSSFAEVRVIALISIPPTNWKGARQG